MAIRLLATNEDGECVDCEELTHLCMPDCEDIVDGLETAYLVRLRFLCFFEDETDPPYNTSHVPVYQIGDECRYEGVGPPVPADGGGGPFAGSTRAEITITPAVTDGVKGMSFRDGYGWQMEIKMRSFQTNPTPHWASIHEGESDEINKSCYRCVVMRDSANPVGAYNIVDDGISFCGLEEDQRTEPLLPGEEYVIVE